MNLSDKSLTPALFLHIQKTAGTSIVGEAYKHYGDSVLSHGDCWGKNPDDIKNVAFISGHIGYDYARNLFKDRFSFTFLRNPIDRVISMYYFCKAQNPKDYLIYEKANTLNFKDFLEAGFYDPTVRKNIWNNQVWQLAHGYAHLDNRTINDFTESELLGLAIEHLDDFSYVGLTETFDSDAKEIFTQLKMSATKPPKINVTESKPLIGDISNEELALLHDLTQLDLQLYSHVLNMRNKQILIN